MAASIASLLAFSDRSGGFERKLGSLRERGAPRSRRRVLGNEHVWLALAAGSVALLLLAAHRRRQTRRACEERARRLEEGPFRWVAGDEALAPSVVVAVPPSPKRPEPAADADVIASGPKRPSEPAAAEARRVWKVPEYSLELPGPQRAAPEVSLGQPAELRRLALELAQSGQAAEAGLLENYALLLERTSVSHERVMAEVTRMLRAAAADRASSRQPGRAEALAPVSPSPASSSGVIIQPRPIRSITAAATYGRDSSPEGPATASAPPAPRPRVVIPLPACAVGARRRASR